MLYYSKEYIDEIRKIDDAVANILSKLDVAAASSAVATNTATAIIADSHSDSNNNKNSNNLNQDNYTEVYRNIRIQKEIMMVIEY